MLNVLNLKMVQALKSKLVEWSKDKGVHFIVLKSNLDKALCAGGDLKEIYAAAHRNDSRFLHTFFEEEYSLNQVIFSYPKPYISFMKGITMGGGMGISVHGSHRIVTDTSILAMPEVFIGFFPDAGGSYFLNRCPGKTGLLLGLSGYRMNAADALYAGLATHYIPQENMPLLLSSLIETDISSNSYEGIQAILELFSAPLPMASQLEENRELIDEYFSEEDIGLLVAGLRLCKNFWLQGVKSKIAEASPLSVAITHYLLRAAKGLSFSEAMAGELKLALKFFNNQEVLEGIRSVVIDKDHSPKWKYKSVGEISDIEIKSYFN
jgi:enoyl-CoA hydratase/carnithine racemase